MAPARKVSHVRGISPAGMPRAGDAIHRVTAALQADEARAPFQHRQIGAMAGCLLAGVDIDPVPAAIAPAPLTLRIVSIASNVRRSGHSCRGSSSASTGLTERRRRT